MNKKEIKQSTKIDMRYFLEVYYGITNVELLAKLSKLPHKEIKEVLSMYGIYLRNMSFDNLTREMIASGEIILVTDSHRNYAPYINPMVSIENEFSTTLDENYISQVKEKIK